MNRVVILQRDLAEYRIPFFRRLSIRLRDVGLELRVYSRRSVNDRSDLDSEGWHTAIRISAPVPWFERLVWQHRPSSDANGDVLVLEHAASILSNPRWMSAQRRSGGLVAYWGHGRNFQRRDVPIVGAWKRHLALRPDWWFGYTEASRVALEAIGVCQDRITVVQNTIDTTALRQALLALPRESSKHLRSELGLPPGPIFCFVGRMYRAKCIQFLIEAFERVLEAENDASLLFVGDGPDRHFVEAKTRAGVPVRALGPLFGNELAAVLRASEAMLMPGLVGLVVVDSFCAGLPLFTTSVPFHSPEISYVKHDENGKITEHRTQVYADQIIAWLRDPVARREMRESCLRSAQELTIETMVERFAAGLESAISRGPRVEPNIRRRTGPSEAERRVARATSRVVLPKDMSAAATSDEVRVAIVTNELPPYRRPVFLRLAQRSGVRVHALLTTQRESHRLWDTAQSQGRLEVEVLRTVTFSHRQWNSEARSHQERRISVALGIGRALRRLSPTITISGGFGAPSLAAWMSSALHRTPFMIWTEETPRSAVSASWLQKRLRRFLLQHADGVLAWGRDAVTYVKQNGIADQRITYCPQAVNVQQWSREIERERNRFEARSFESLPRVVLFAGQLLERKGILELLDVWASLTPQQRNEAELWIAGNGPLESELRRRVSASRLSSVQVLGAVRPEELPKVYARACLLVLPSLIDIWGLVVNEAMSGGVPALVSRHAGAAELVLNGVNGALFDPKNPLEFSARLVEWIERSPRVDRAAIRLHLQQWSVEACEDAMISGIRRVIPSMMRRDDGTLFGHQDV
jgi:glycosyltransferase involved in cell wall biosynthesis